LKYRPVSSCSSAATVSAPVVTRSVSPDGTKTHTMGFSSEPSGGFGQHEVNAPAAIRAVANITVNTRFVFTFYSSSFEIEQSGLLLSAS
jgi:hypothetical protein